MKLLLIISLLVFPSLSGYAQTPAPSPSAGLIPATAESALATIHVFRQDREFFAWGFLTRTLPIYFGERVDARGKLPKIAGIRNQRYFVMRVPAGKYLFDTQKMRGKLELEVAAGGEYYLLVDHGLDCPGVSSDPQIDADCTNRDPSIELAQREHALQVMAKLKPIDRKHNKNSKLVSVPTKP